MQDDIAINEEYFTAMLENKTPSRYVSELLPEGAGAPPHQHLPEAEEP